MKNKFICLDFCNGELKEEKEYTDIEDIINFYEKAEEPIIIYGKIIYKEKEN